MRGREIVAELIANGCQITADGDTLRVQGPLRSTLTDELREAIRAHKAELLALLARSPANDTGHVGRHGEPCPQCGETWQWPTTSGTWVCSWCICAGPETPEVAPRHPPCPECTSPASGRAGTRWVCLPCDRVWPLTEDAD